MPWLLMLCDWGNEDIIPGLPPFEQLPQKLTNFTRAELGTILFLLASLGQSQTKL